MAFQLGRVDWERLLSCQPCPLFSRSATRCPPWSPLDLASLLSAPQLPWSGEHSAKPALGKEDQTDHLLSVPPTETASVSGRMWNRAPLLPPPALLSISETFDTAKGRGRRPDLQRCPDLLDVTVEACWRNSSPPPPGVVPKLNSQSAP